MDEEVLEVESVEQQIGIDIDEWPGNCYGIAHAMLRHSVVGGRLRYGHWNGPIADGSLFDGHAIVRHGWIEQDDGRVVDPTRWVFEDDIPYIYQGENDFYDMGGDEVRLANQRPAPAPEGRSVPLNIEGEAALFVHRSVGVPVDELRLSHVFWLANLSRATLGEYLIDIFRALIEAGLTALIPIDNLQYYDEVKEL